MIMKLDAQATGKRSQSFSEEPLKVSGDYCGGASNYTCCPQPNILSAL